MKSKIAAVVVTYNRKELLAVCLDAILKQEYKPHTVYIIDNASTDGTEALVHELGCDKEKEGIVFRFVKLPDNIGGSGGFYTGMKMAFESPEKFDAFWLMDDDGIPDARQLERLVQYLGEVDYLSPMVLAKEDSSILSFGNIRRDEMENEAEKGLVYGAANPFNGVLYSRRLVDTVGYPVRDMFMWGDEINYGLRCIKAGFKPAMVVDAIHIHPRDRQVKIKSIFREIVAPEQDWKLYMYVRNAMYTNRTLTRRRHAVKERVYMTIDYSYQLLCKKSSWRRWRIAMRGIRDGWKKDLTRLDEYRNV